MRDDEHPAIVALVVLVVLVVIIVLVYEATSGASSLLNGGYSPLGLIDSGAGFVLVVSVIGLIVLAVVLAGGSAYFRSHRLGEVGVRSGRRRRR